MRSAPRGIACQPRSLRPALWQLETGIQAIQLSPCTPYSVLSTGLRRPISRRFPACSGPVLLSEFQSFPTPVSRASKSHNQQAPFFRTLPSSPRLNGARRPASIPCAIRCRSPEALALGAAGIACRRRYHCPERGCLFNRSRDCSRLGARGHFMPASLSLPLRRLPFLCLPSNAITKMTREITSTAADVALFTGFLRETHGLANAASVCGLC